jgi:DNA-binding MarR family transcriptional regulator
MYNSRLKKGFGMVSTDVMRDVNISLAEKALYAYLSIFADKDTNELYVSVNTIATECCMGVSTVHKHINQLVKKGVIDRKYRGYNNSKTTILLK